MCCRRRFLNCFLQLLHRPIPLLVLGYKFRRIRDIVCWMDDLAGREGPFHLGFVNVLLQPIFTRLVFVVGTDNVASAFVGNGRAPAARSRPHRILAVEPMADHDQPSSLLPHGFVSDVSLRAAFRWTKNCVFKTRITLGSLGLSPHSRSCM